MRMQVAKTALKFPLAFEPNAQSGFVQAGGGWTHGSPMATPSRRPPLELVLGLTLSLTFVATLVLCAIGCYKHRRERENQALMASSNVHPNANVKAAVKPLAGATQQGRLSPSFLATMVQVV